MRRILQHWFLCMAVLLPIRVWAQEALVLQAGNAEALAIAEARLARVEQGKWTLLTGMERETLAPSNPDVVVPDWRIFCGVGLTSADLDAESLHRVTRRLFAAYGVPLQARPFVDLDGVTFHPDGWNAERKIGYALLDPRSIPKVEAYPPRPFPMPPEALSSSEFTRLQREIAAGEVSVLLLDPTRYRAYNEDAWPGTRAYLQSVLDYLDWLEAEGRL